MAIVLEGIRGISIVYLDIYSLISYDIICFIQNPAPAHNMEMFPCFIEFGCHLLQWLWARGGDQNLIHHSWIHKPSKYGRNQFDGSSIVQILSP